MEGLMSWEYKLETLVVRTNYQLDVVEVLNRLGKEGWELVQIIQNDKEGNDQDFLYLKRLLKK
jgi:hypothetical protein